MRPVVAGVIMVTVAGGGLPSGVVDAGPTRRPAPQAVLNPPVEEACGVDITLVLDASGSIQSSDAVDDVRDAAHAFLTALKDTNSTARVVDFGTVARETAPPGALVTTDSLAAGGVHREAIDKYYNPKPPLQPGVTAYEFRGGDVNSTSSYRAGSTSQTQYTNWDQALDQAGRQPADLIVFITDGDPTAVDSDQAGDPFYVVGKDPPNVRFNMSSGAAQTLALNRAVEEADAAKTSGSRILSVGVGNAVTGNTASINRLKAVSGPNVATTVDQFDLATTDVALVADFAELGAALRGVVTELCAPSFTVRKLAQTPGSIEFTPRRGWDITLTPTVAGGNNPPYAWILPQVGLPVGPVTRPTDVNGFVQFQWEPSPPDATTMVEVVEQTGDPYTPVDYRCEVRDIDGNVRVEEGPLTGAFSLSVASLDIVTCTLRNSFDYAPGIAITKTDNPTLVRGDLSPPAQVVSTFVVTNTGNADLGSVHVSDDRCAPVAYVAGDTNTDSVLQTTETWTYSCTRDIVASVDDVPLTITNLATVDAVDPAKTEVTATDDAEIDVVVPVIDIVKTVRTGGTTDAFVDALSIAGAGTSPVEYRMVVTNPGNVPLGSVAVNDPDCSPVTGPTGDTNTDAILQPSEMWTYLCSTTATGDVVNVATVEGTPALAGLTPGPAVTDTDDASVTFIEANLDLKKIVDISVALPGDVAHYTYTVTNTGAATLVPNAGETRDDMVHDDIGPAVCIDPAYFDGDTDDDSLMLAGEAWRYTCSTPITLTNSGTNVASVTMLVEGTATTLTREAKARVRLEVPAVTIIKDSLRPVVLDPNSAAIAGPDVPLVAPAVYLYQVVNDGTLPLEDVVVTDDVCGAPTYLSGNSNNDNRLDVDEVWEFRCVQTTLLTKADGVPANDPRQPSVVTNTGKVTGTPVLGVTLRPDRKVIAEATAQTTVIAPRVSLAKTADSTLVRRGDVVTYTYEVTASGDSPVQPTGVADDLCSPVRYVDGDVDGNRFVDLDETWTYTCSATLYGPSPVVNNAAVLATGGLGNLYAATAVATVTVFGTSIALDKSVSAELVARGSTVSYTFAVTNTGTDPINDVLAEITIADVSAPANAACTTPAFVSGDADGDDALDLDERWLYRCTGTVDQLTIDVAGVAGTDILGGVVTDFDSAVVAPFDTGISVVKTASTATLPQGGGPVTYTYEVRNTGNVPLGGVTDRVTDDKCVRPTYIAGDNDGNGLLTGEGDIFEAGGPEVWTFQCTTTITVTTLNTVTAIGTPRNPTTGEVLAPDVSAVARATVTVDSSVTRPPTGQLPGTGFDGSRLLWLVLALVTLGGAMRLSASRRWGRTDRAS